MSRILHSFCIEMPAPGGKLERITSIFFLCFFSQKFWSIGFWLPSKWLLNLILKLFYSHNFSLCVKMHIKCGVVFWCRYVLVQVVSGFCLGTHTENYPTMCFIFVADASKTTRDSIQQLKYTPGTLWRTPKATFPRKTFPILTEVSRERTQLIGIGPPQQKIFI